MNNDKVRMKTHHWTVFSVAMIVLGCAPLTAGPGINQLTTAIQQNIQIARADLQATLTTENAIYADITTTLTIANNIVFNAADSYATMTTANSIKYDTQNTITIGNAILQDAIATETTTDLALTEAYATMTTANAIKGESQQTVLNDQTSTAYLAAITTLTETLYTDVHASLTTANAILPHSIRAANFSDDAYNTLNATNTIIQSIKAGTTSLLTQVNQVQTDVHDTYTSANLIAAQTSVLALPVVGTTTINAAGSYRVVNPINPCQIIINHDNVCLMLNGLNISNAGVDVIVINPGIKNVYIANGQIIGGGATTVSGIRIGNPLGAFCENITIEHVVISSVLNGIAAENTSQCIFRDIRSLNSTTGISASSANLLRIRECVFQNDLSNARENSVGIVINNNSLINGVGPSIRDCTISNFGTSINLGSTNNAEIINCKLGDFSLNYFPLGKTIFSSILLSYCSNIIIDNCSIQNIVLGALVSGKTINGINCVLSPNCVISNCNIQNLQAKASPSTVVGITLATCPNMDVGYCTVNDLVASTAYGYYFSGSTSTYNFIHDCIASYIQGSTTGYGFYMAPDDPTTILFRNIGTTPTAPTINFSPNITNVTSGYNGTNVIYNFSLPT